MIFLYSLLSRADIRLHWSQCAFHNDKIRRVDRNAPMASFLWIKFVWSMRKKRADISRNRKERIYPDGSGAPVNGINRGGWGGWRIPLDVSHKRFTEPRHERKCVITTQITMLALPYASYIPRDNYRELASIDGQPAENVGNISRTEYWSHFATHFSERKLEIFER